MKAFPVVCAALAVCLLLAPLFVIQADAYSYGASVSYQNPNFVYDSQQMAASLNSTTLNGFTSASASFYAGAPVVSAIANTYTGYTQASASVGDWLLFSGPTGSYTDVTIHIAGNWGVYLDRTAVPGTAPWVRFSVGFTPQWSSGSITYDSWRSWSSGSIQQSGSLTAAGGWTEFAGGDESNASGTYSFDFTTRVYYGYYYHLTLGVTAESTGPSHRARIDDPLTIALSDGVSFTSLSGTSYTAAPVPPSLLLLAPGLIGLAAARRRFRK
jgi:hypothetical protein